MSQDAAHIIAQELSGLDVKFDAPLAKHTTFGVGGPADIFVVARNAPDLLRVIAACKSHNVPMMILGGGSNVLISDKGIRGVVVQLKGELAQIVVSDNGKRIDVGAGASFPMLTKTAIVQGWEGALGWCGTPGLVGGALIMNAGSRIGELGDVVHEVHCILDGEHKVLSHEAAQFRYRQTSFPRGAIITGATLIYANADSARKDEFLQKSAELAVRRKATQPKAPSAGSMFKNPENDFAGRLIEACGLKGTRVGGAEVSPVHANFIVNVGGATAQDLFELSRLVRAKVEQQFGVLLQYEVRLIGDFDTQA